MGSVWRDARTIADLGRNMAGWLEGTVPSWPGYGADFGYEEDDASHLVPVLAAANRAGFVTTGSQPASDRVGYDGARWRQRAAVDGIVHERNPLLGRLTALERQGFGVFRGWPKLAIAITDRNGEPQTGFGGFRLGRDHAAREWHGIGRRALRELRQHGVVLHIVDPVWGRDDRLWPALTNAIR